MKLNDAFDLNVECDDVFVHPSKFCNTCYSNINNYLKRGKRPTIKVFTRCDHNNECGTCKRGSSKSLAGGGGGGRPAKRKAPGGNRFDVVKDCPEK